MTDDRDAMRKTILARIATRDTSIPNPTPEQFAETTRLLEGVLKSLGGKHKDYALMLKLLKDLRTRKGASKQPPAEPAEGSVEASGDPRELQV